VIGQLPCRSIRAGKKWRPATGLATGAALPHWPSLLRIVQRLALKLTP
jgi:hypothetical protein